MGITKQDQLKEMDSILESLDDGPINFIQEKFRQEESVMDNFEEQMEDRLIEKQIEDELQTLNELEADMSTEQKAAYAHLSEGMTMAKERVVLIKNILSGYKYKYDDAAFCAKENHDHALSIGETIEDFHLIQQSIEDDEIKTGENQ